MWSREEPDNLLLVCGGTHEQAAHEDVLCAGALCDLLWKDFYADGIADSTKPWRERCITLRPSTCFRWRRNPAMACAWGGFRSFSDDVPYCLQKNLFAFAAGLNRQGKVQKI